MTDCPADAIHKSPDGEVFIDEKCIGCGNCMNACPYDAIHMTAPAPPKPGLLSWLLFGAGPGPGGNGKVKGEKDKGADGPKVAVKCDACMDIEGGHACVRACPTGAAFRISPEEYFTTDYLVR